ncbi:M4 family metallopeptidase [Streptomyces sp. MST-110588]|uniref:M4 family metallopeptidase n=1 Tax=Streptomyces sp. MST-110588 TaxID=2833628 RepID=UPI001F5D98EF|nr:M4 family metallopeptidase [Streptomyces sp. MST-110588]UNO43346.1 M4 family metallopeptidase [Streptomyces sp. MST-110588]
MRAGASRAPRTRAPRRRISGAAALIGVAALLVSAVPAGAAVAADGAAPPSPGQVIPGQKTATPALVEGIREQAPHAGNAAGAARAYLAGRQDRYHIPAPGRDLTPVRTTTAAGGRETVRLQQKYRGVPVLGGQYVVQMERKDGDRVVTGTSGKYFTGLRTGTTPEVAEAVAVERAVDAVRAELEKKAFSGRGKGKDGGTGEEGEPSLTGASHGLVVLPLGAGVLTRHVTVRGMDPASGEPVLREVYLDARAGYPVLQYSGIKTFGTPGGIPASARAGTAGEESVTHRQPGAAQPGPGVPGSGVKLDGRSVELQVARDEGRNAYVMRDHSRMQNSSGNVLDTWDARGKWVDDVLGKWPADLLEFSSPTPAFGTDATESGAVDAHWAAGKVYDYYKSKHGRDSLDGHGMAIHSLVGVSDFGLPFVNAFWDGQKMVYGNGDAEYRPLAAGLDVVGHEMTHGVVEHTAGLVYAGQSGALDEAIADYFGNAVESDVYGIPVEDPDSGLLGERLCRTKGPRQCAIRDLNDGRNTAKHFLGVGFGTDNGGVHLNSTIFSGALWDAREDLGATLTDRIVYKALSEYLTPLDGFTEARNAVLAAAKALAAGPDDLRALERAFNAHGIVPGWELALGVDSDVLLARVNTADSRLGAGGAWWVAAKSNEDGSEPYSVWAGRNDGKGQLKLMSPNDGRFHVNPATDGRYVVWQAYGPGRVEILARPLAGGPVKKLWSGRSAGSSVAVDGDIVTFESRPRGGIRYVTYLRISDPSRTQSIGGGRYWRTYFPSVHQGRIAYQETRRVRGTTYAYSTRLRDVATGEDRVVQKATAETGLGPTAVTGKHVFWLLDAVPGDGRTALRRAGLDGSDAVDLSPESGPDALNISDLTASQTAVTVGARVPGPGPGPGLNNESLAKLWQFAADGAPQGEGVRKGRVSCNRGEQLSPAAAPGSQVVWLDATTGISNLVTRTRPAGRCG